MPVRLDLDAIGSLVIEQMLEQCRCGVVAGAPPTPDTLAALLQRRCLIVLSLPPAQALRLAGAARQRLPDATLLPDIFVEAGESFCLLVNPDTFDSDAVETLLLARGLAAAWQRGGRCAQYWMSLSDETVHLTIPLTTNASEVPQIEFRLNGQPLRFPALF